MDQWHYAYWLVGCLQIPNFIWIFIFALRDELCSKKVEELNLEDKEFVPENKEFVPETKELEVVIISDEKSKSSRNVLMLGLITVFLLLYVGSESAFGSYLHTYAFLHLKFEKDTAAYLNSAFWASFAFGRLCGIPLSLKFSSLQMIFSDLIGCIASLALLLVLNKSALILWIGSLLFGLSVASIYPSAIAYTEKYVTITGKRMSILAVGGASGDAVIPLLIGYSMNSKLIGTVGFILVSFVVVSLASLLFVFIVLYVRHQSKKEEQDVK
jgi:fucose permease